MEFANDLLAGLRGKLLGASSNPAAPGIDWPGLHARFAAAHAARLELGRCESLRIALSGSFAGRRNPFALPSKSLPGVNRTDSADGKAPAGMESPIAGKPGAGDRGQE